MKNNKNPKHNNSKTPQNIKHNNNEKKAKKNTQKEGKQRKSPLKEGAKGSKESLKETNKKPNNQTVKRKKRPNGSKKKTTKSEKTPVLVKTEKKATIPHKDFTLSVEKIHTLKDKGYTDLQEVGHGSYGKVYKAMSVTHKAQVAIKVMDLNKLSQIFLENFLNVEIELVRKLPQHPNVTKYYEAIEAPDSQLLYIVMEYCMNGDLFDYILKRQTIPESQACLWYKQLISGIEHIHNNGYAHRDLKCENLLLNNKYEIKIIDFGFCCRLKYSTTIENENQFIPSRIELLSNTFCGSYIYASPELLKSVPYLPTKTDIWSSGVILYVMLFGSYPNDGYELEQFIQKDEHNIEIPTFPVVSEECKELLNNILVNENKRFSIHNIKKSKWFKKQWEDIPNHNDIQSIRDYFENLNITRVETEEFIITENQQIESESSEENASSLDTPEDSTQ